MIKTKINFCVVGLALIFILSFTLLSIGGVGSASSECRDISFVKLFSGVDGNTDKWSLNGDVKNLKTSTWSLLDNSALVSGYSDGVPHFLTQRGTRGLGVAGQEGDEIDSRNTFEEIIITFDESKIINSFEVRSLFKGAPEQGDADFYLDDHLVANYHLVGILKGDNGVLTVPVPDVIADKIIFYVKPGEEYTSYSEFAVAKISVCDLEEEPVCGNDIEESGEDCDDGNLVNGDGCDEFCMIEPPTCTQDSDCDECACEYET